MGLLVLNRPAVLNALNSALLAELEALLSALGAACGAGGAVAGASLVNGLNLRFSPPGIAGSLAFQVRPEPVHVAAAVTLVLAVCAISAVLAARRQVGRKVVDLLAG